MARSLKDNEVKQLAAEIAKITGESETEALRTALIERRNRLLRKEATPAVRRQQLRDFLEYEIWPQIPTDVLGVPISKEEVEAILGFGRAGV